MHSEPARFRTGAGNTLVGRTRHRRNRSRRCRSPLSQTPLGIELLEDRLLLANWSGDIPNGTVWPPVGEPPGTVQRIVGNVRIPSGATLTIEPGTVIKFNDFADFALAVEGTLIADGTTSLPIVFTTFADDTGLDGMLGTADDQDSNGNGPSNGVPFSWQRIEFRASSTGSMVDYVDVRFGGENVNAQVLVAGELTMTNSIVRNSATAGMRIQASTPTVTGTEFRNNAGAAISMDLASNPAISTPTLTNNGVNGVALDGFAALTQDAVWDDAGIVYRLVGPLTVPAGRTLTIGPGQIVKAVANVSTEIFVDGTLVADGTPEAPIIFTSDRDDTVGGDTNNNGQSSGQIFDWQSLHFRATSSGNVLDHIEVRFAGANVPGAINVIGAPVALTDSLIRDSATTGIRIVDSDPIIARTKFQNNLGAAISMDLASNPTITAPVLLGNAVNGVNLDGGTLPGDARWDDPDIVYRMTTHVTVPQGATLSVGAGQIIKSAGFNEPAVFVSGTLNAVGTLARPIILTSDRDDSAGGDTNNDGSTTTFGGENGGLVFNPGGAGNLNHVEVRYAGDPFVRAAVVINDAEVTMSHSLIRDSGQTAVRVQSSDPSLVGAAFQNNAGPAISIDLASNPAFSEMPPITSNGFNGVLVDGGTLPGDLAWTGQNVPYSLGGNVTIPVGRTLTIGTGVSFFALDFRDFQGAGTINSAGTITKAQGNSTSNISPVLNNSGILRVESGTLSPTTVNFSGSAIVTGLAGTTLAVKGNLVGDTGNAARFAPLSAVTFNGTGTLASPQLLEAMSEDRGNVGGGYGDNFAYFTLSLSNNTRVKLVDNSDNFAGPGGEAIYTGNLIVPSGSTLDLNGLQLYARTTQISGTVTGGTVSIVADGGPFELDTPTPGAIAAVGQIDDWSFFGRAGQTVTVQLATGAAGSPAPTSPALSSGRMTLLDPSGNALGTASNAQAGADATLAGVALPADGVYHVQVRASAALPNSTGNYVLTAWNATTQTVPLNLNVRTNGQIDTPFRVDRWTFSAVAGEVVRFDLVNATDANVLFDLTGPSGFTAFSNSTADSDSITLPTTGSYAVVVHTTPKRTGSYAFRVDQTMVTPLTFDTPQIVPLAGGPQSDLFSFEVDESQQVLVTLMDSAADDRNEVYVKFGAAPTRFDYQFRFSNPASANQQVAVPSAAPGTWYVLVFTEGAPLPGSYSLEVNGSDVFLTDVAPDQAGNGADMTLNLSGLGFDGTTTVSLVSASNTVFAANDVHLDLPTQITATFNAGAVPAGVYDVRVNKGGDVSILPDVFTVTQGGESQLTLNLVVPSSLGYHIPGTIWLEYGNVGSLAMPAPILLMTPTQTHADMTTDAKAFLTLDPALFVTGFWTSAEPAGFRHTIEVLASGSTPGVLQPGESVRVPIYYVGWEQPWDLTYPAFSFGVNVIGADNTSPLDWDTFRDSLPGISDAAAKDALISNLQAQSGLTLGDYVQTLDENASYLGQLGVEVSDIGKLFAFGLARANGLSVYRDSARAIDAGLAAPGMPLAFGRTFSNSITGRYELGPFGRGWSLAGGFDGTLEVLADGTVLIRGTGGAQGVFQPDSRGGYFSSTGDSGVLSSAGGGAFTIRETDGTTTGYRPDGKFDYVQDSTGNRITAGYVNNLLASLTHTSGQSIQITYNGAGRIASVTDSLNRSTTYTYDAGNEHLMSVTGSEGELTSYTYSVGGSAPTEHAILSASHPDGTHTFYSYDSMGRLSNVRPDNVGESIQFTYEPGGQVTATDSLGASTHTYFDHRGLVLRVDDPLNRSTFYTYNDRLQMVGRVDPAGQSYTYSYDPRGNPLQFIDPLGRTTTFRYGASSARLESVADAKGNTLRFAYDVEGNLLSTAHPDGSVERMAYDPIGNVISSTNRRGQVVQYTYDAAGRVLSKTFDDNSQALFTYDAHGNLTSATDPLGTTTLTYDTDNNLTTLTDPNGLTLSYTYDSTGRRTQMVDQTGFTVNYGYDVSRRLTTLNGPSGNIATYSYDALSRLQRTEYGNGTATTIEYDLAGQLIHKINRGPGQSISSRFDYTYDLLGRVATMATLEGAWVYSYDAVGQLTHAVFTSNNPGAIPHQDLAYEYDAAGNRTQTIINGVAATYATNSLNQYTTVGGNTYAYDADGNINNVTDASGVTRTYSYDTENTLVGSSAPGDTWTYRYDALGNRVQMTHNNVTTNDLVNPFGLGEVVGQFDEGGGLIAHYTQGLALVSRVGPGNTSAYYHFDGAGNTAALTDGSGVAVNRYAYLPFGEPLSTTQTLDNPFQYVGEFGVMREGSGLDFMRARFYDPVGGRFTQQDPIRLGGGLNFYRYASNDPVGHVDPSGLSGYTPLHYLNWTRPELLEIAEALGRWYQDSRGWRHVMADFARRGVTLAEVPLLAESTLGFQAGEELAKFRARRAIIAQLGGGGRALTTGISSFAAPAAPSALARAGGILARGGGVILRVLGGALNVYAVYEAGKTGWNAGLWVRDRLTRGSTGIIQKWDDFWFNLFEGQPDTVKDGSRNVSSKDPNQKIGPVGFGPQGFIQPGPLFPYRIDFENDKDATAPAQRVTITDPLSANLDWDTLQFTEVGFGDTLLAVPPGSQHFATTVEMTFNNTTFNVEIEVGFRSQTGEVFAVFQSIDPQTQLPPDVLTGFLPPEDETGRGQGHVSYTILPVPNLPTGTQIRNVALITFDSNASIATDQVDPHDPSQGTDPAKQALNTIDATAPTSSVAALPAQSAPTFTVSWSGNDGAGSGIASFDVFVSDNGGLFQLFRDDTTATSAMFSGERSHTYGFFSVATDNVRFTQPTPASAQATTTVPNDTTDPVLANMPTDRTVTATGPGGAAVTYALPTATDDIDPSPDVSCLPASGSTFAVGMTTVTCTATDDAGNSDSEMFKVTVLPLDNTGPTIDRMDLVRDARGKKVLRIVLTFSESLNEAGAETPANYALETRSRSKVKPVAFGTPVYDSGTVTFTPVKAISTKKLPTVFLTARGTGTLTDASTNLNRLDGDRDGTPGGDFVRSLSQGAILSAVDELLESGDLSSRRVDLDELLQSVLGRFIHGLNKSPRLR